MDPLIINDKGTELTTWLLRTKSSNDLSFLLLTFFIFILCVHIRMCIIASARACMIGNYKVNGSRCTRGCDNKRILFVPLISADSETVECKEHVGWLVGIFIGPVLGGVVVLVLSRYFDLKKYSRLRGD